MYTSMAPAPVRDDPDLYRSTLPNDKDLLLMGEASKASKLKAFDPSTPETFDSWFMQVKTAADTDTETAYRGRPSAANHRASAARVRRHDACRCRGRTRGTVEARAV